MTAPLVRVLDSDSADSFRVCVNAPADAPLSHGTLGSYAMVDGRPHCYSCTYAAIDAAKAASDDSPTINGIGLGDAQGWPPY